MTSFMTSFMTSAALLAHAHLACHPALEELGHLGPVSIRACGKFTSHQDLCCPHHIVIVGNVVSRVLGPCLKRPVLSNEELCIG